MSHLFKKHHNKKESTGLLSKLLASGALLTVGKKLYNNKKKIKDILTDENKKEKE